MLVFEWISKSKNPYLAIPAKGLMMAPLSPTSDLTTLSFSLPMASKLVGKGVSFQNLFQTEMFNFIVGEEVEMSRCQSCIKVVLKCRVKAVSILFWGCVNVVSTMFWSCFKSCLKPDSGWGGGWVQGDGHHHQEQKSFQRHRDWLLNILTISVCQFVLC